MWDYAGDNYVHRLVQSKGDGKLVEVDERGNMVGGEKLDSITLEVGDLVKVKLDFIVLVVGDLVTAKLNSNTQDVIDLNPDLLLNSTQLVENNSAGFSVSVFCVDSTHTY